MLTMVSLPRTAPSWETTVPYSGPMAPSPACRPDRRLLIFGHEEPRFRPCAGPARRGSSLSSSARQQTPNAPDGLAGWCPLLQAESTLKEAGSFHTEPWCRLQNEEMFVRSQKSHGEGWRPQQPDGIPIVPSETPTRVSWLRHLALCSLRPLVLP